MRKIITRVAVAGSAATLIGFGAIGCAVTPQEQQPTGNSVQEDKPKSEPKRVDGNAPEANWRDYESPIKDDEPVKPDPEPQRQSPQREQSTTQQQPAPESNEGKVQAEDGTWVDPEFYDRTDYNNNGITDQTEPGWNNGAGEEAFKNEATEQYYKWCESNPNDRNCN